jgi:redox-sensitive bicupin YhaK (pirin superfamily)
LHAEFNDIETGLHLYQIWFLPKEKNLTPDYQNYRLELKKNVLNLLVSNDKKDEIGFLNADVKVMRGQFEGEKSFSYFLAENKGMFLYLYK